MNVEDFAQLLINGSAIAVATLLLFIPFLKVSKESPFFILLCLLFPLHAILYSVFVSKKRTTRRRVRGSNSSVAPTAINVTSIDVLAYGVVICLAFLGLCLNSFVISVILFPMGVAAIIAGKPYLEHVESPRSRVSLKKVLLEICCGIVSVAIVVGVHAIRSRLAERATQFDSLLAQYLAIEQKAYVFMPYIRGRIVVVLKESGRPWQVDNTLGRPIPNDLRAETPADVGTVVFIAHTKKNVGRYKRYGEPRANAIQIVTKLQIADFLKKKIIFEKEIEGPAPPEVIGGDLSENPASPSHNEISRFIRSCRAIPLDAADPP